MKSFKLRNLKAESGILGLLILMLGLLIDYWAYAGHRSLSISGAKLDPTTSSALLYIIGIGPLLIGTNLLIKFFSVLRYGEFTMTLTNDKFTYPAYGMFKGFKKVEVEKNQASEVKLYSENNKPVSFYFVNKEKKTPDIIETEILDPSVNAVELVDQLNQWLKS